MFGLALCTCQHTLHASSVQKYILYFQNIHAGVLPEHLICLKRKIFGFTCPQSEPFQRHIIVLQNCELCKTVTLTLCDKLIVNCMWRDTISMLVKPKMPYVLFF